MYVDVYMDAVVCFLFTFSIWKVPDQLIKIAVVLAVAHQHTNHC